MKKLRALDPLCLFPAAAAYYYSSCLCRNKDNSNNISSKSSSEDKQPLVDSPLKLKDAIDDNTPPPTLAFHLKPKMVALRVSMHCSGCARQVKKQISKMEGVTSYEIDLETKLVLIKGDIVPFEVLESVSKVKYAELWNDE